jgi:hypothetical protein
VLKCDKLISSLEKKNLVGIAVAERKVNRRLIRKVSAADLNPLLRDIHEDSDLVTIF